MRWPRKETREHWEFIFKAIQVVAIVAGAGWALWTYSKNSAEQRDAVRRELRKPYDEKQLSLYLEAARVLAHLASTSGVQRDEYETRFWELYWGELPFVESKVVRSKMIAFCVANFDEQRCGNSPTDKTPANERVKAAIDMAEAASCQIRSRWTPMITIKIAAPLPVTAKMCPPDEN